MNQPLLSSPCRRLANLLMVLLALAGCDSSEEKNSGARLPELNIERDAAAADQKAAFGEFQRARNWQSRAAAGQPFLVSYRLPRQVAESPSLSAPVDPFAAGRDVAFSIFQETLEQVGVTFAEGTWALYDPQQQIASAYQTVDQHELIKAYFDSIKYDPERSVHVHFEVFEVAADEAKAILQIGGDNEKYQTLQSWLTSGRARMAGVASTPAREGQRCNSETVIEVSTTDPTIVGGSSKMVGLIVEFDLVRSIDDDGNQGLDFRAQLSTTKFRTAAAPKPRKEDLLALPPPASFLTELLLPFDRVNLLGMLAPPSDIAATEPMTSSSDDPVLFAFVRASDYAIHASAAQNPKLEFDDDGSNPFDNRTHVYSISRGKWKAFGEHLYGGYGQAPVAFSNPELLTLLPDSFDRLSLTSTFSEFGFKFSAHDQLVYESESETLIASLNAFEMSRLDLLFRHFMGKQAQHNITQRVEIFEVPTPLCLQLAGSAALGPDHTPEWQAVRQLVEDGYADEAGCLLTKAKSAQRSGSENTSEQIFVSDYAPPPPSGDENNDRKDESEKPKTNRRSPTVHPQFKTRSIGSILHSESIIAADQASLDVVIAFDHHTAQPEQIARTLQFPESKGGRITDVSAPVFHRHRTYAHTSMAIGSTRILAMWRPSGLPRYENGDLMQIAFLRATVSPGHQIVRIR